MERIKKLAMRGLAVLYAMAGIASLIAVLFVGDSDISSRLAFSLPVLLVTIGASYWLWKKSTVQFGAFSQGVLVLLALFALSPIIGQFVGGSKSKETPKKELTKEEKEKADKKTFALQMAGFGYLDLKKSAKDPASFSAESIVIKDNGFVCYTFRAMNSFGARLPGHAVMTDKGKLYASEGNSAKFVSNWNANCTKSGGEEVGWFITRQLD